MRLTRNRTLVVLVFMCIGATLFLALVLHFGVGAALLGGALLLAMGVYYLFYFYSVRSRAVNDREGAGRGDTERLDRPPGPG